MIRKKKEENLSFFNGLAKSYDAPLLQFWMEKFHRGVLKEVSEKKRFKILDVGCGTGKLLEKLRGRSSLFGVDLSLKMLEVAKERLENKATLVEGDVHKLPFKNNFFDYTISTEAFHHYYAQSKALEEMKRVTVKGGKVIVVDINFFLRFIHYLFEKFEPGCVKVNNKKEIYALFEKAGLQNIRQKRAFLFAVMSVGYKN